MTFYDRKFVRELRRRVRREARPKLWWRIVALRHWLPIGVQVIVLFYLYNLRSEFGAHAFWGALYVLTGLAMFLTLLCTGYMETFFQGDAAMPALTQMPVTSLQVWREGAKRAFRFLGWVIFDASVTLWWICYTKHLGLRFWVAAPLLSVLLCGVAVVLAVACHWKWWRILFCWVGVVFPLLFFVSLLFWFAHNTAVSADIVAAYLRELHRVVIWSTPPGWALQIAEWVVLPHRPFPAVAMGLLVVASIWSIDGVRQLERSYQFWHRRESLPPRRGRMTAPIPPAQPAERLEELEERIRTREFLTPKLGRGRLERFLEPASAREKSVRFLLLVQTIKWDSLYLSGLISIALSPLVAQIGFHWLPRVPSQDHASGWGVLFLELAGLMFVLGIACSMLLPGDIWRGMLSRQSGLRFISMASLLPVEPEEIRKTMRQFKVRQFVAALPAFVLAGLVSAFTFKMITPSAGIRFALEAWLILMLQPFGAVFHFAQCLSSRFVTWLVPLFLCVSAIAACGWTCFLINANSAWYWQVVGFLAIGVTSLLCEAQFFRLYCSQRSDLIRKLSFAGAINQRQTRMPW